MGQQVHGPLDKLQVFAVGGYLPAFLARFQVDIDVPVMIGPDALKSFAQVGGHREKVIQFIDQPVADENVGDVQVKGGQGIIVVELVACLLDFVVDKKYMVAFPDQHAVFQGLLEEGFQDGRRFARHDGQNGHGDVMAHGTDEFQDIQYPPFHPLKTPLHKLDHVVGNPERCNVLQVNRPTGSLTLVVFSGAMYRNRSWLKSPVSIGGSLLF